MERTCQAIEIRGITCRPKLVSFDEKLPLIHDNDFSRILGGSNRFSIWNIPATEYLNGLLPPCQSGLAMVPSVPVQGTNLHCLVDCFVRLRDHFLYFNYFFRLGISFLPKLFKCSEDLMKA